MSAIEYGVLAFKNGEIVCGDCCEYTLQLDNIKLEFYRFYLNITFNGIEKFKLFWNSYHMYENGVNLYEWGKEYFRKSVHFSVGDITDFHLKYLGRKDMNNINILAFSHKGDRYTVIYGYAIDKIDIWNKIKIEWCGKKLARKVDKFILKGYNNIKRSSENG